MYRVFGQLVSSACDEGPRSDFLKVWNSILLILTRGCRWIGLARDPNVYCSKLTAHRWLILFKKAHVFDRVLIKLLQIGINEGKIDLSQVAVDGFPQLLGEEKKLSMFIKGKGCLLHLVVEKKGKPLWITTTDTNENEREHK